MKAAGIFPKLRLGTKIQGSGVKSTGLHTVKMVSDKITKGRDRESGTIIDVVKYVVEEDGVQKEYRVPLKNKETGELHYLVQVLSKVEEGDVVTMEMKKMGARNYVEVLNPDGSRIEAEDEDDESDVEDVKDDEHVADDLDALDTEEGKDDIQIP